LVAKFKSGLEAIKDAMKINPNDSEVHYILGKLSLAFNDSKNALTHFDSSLAK
jgi:Flp pilus assembly protein TadD